MKSSPLPHANWELQRRRLRKKFQGRVPARDVADLVEETITTALHNQQALDARQSPSLKVDDQVAAWLSRLAQYKLLEYFERCRREREILERAIEAGQKTLDELRLARDPSFKGDGFFALLKSVLKGCSPSLEMTVKLYLTGRSGEEIARELGESQETIEGRLSRFRRMVKRRLHELRQCESSPQTIYVSEISLQHSVLQVIEQETTGSDHLSLVSLRNYVSFVDDFTQLDEGSRECLKLARNELESCELSLDDKEYAAGELARLTKELGQENPSSSRLRRLLCHLKELAPPIASILASIASLAKLLKG